ncbi:hypothetical protein LWI29_019217 [Acer saccharum]|uniref:CCHC-type domain-containing protein n=1 Tax=Acer saccharum TaxID=4024 RepID=A0AA39VED3_ACESA|nr:hypothetical protein LWI29_019217 [Acer saccharum]
MNNQPQTRLFTGVVSFNYSVSLEKEQQPTASSLFAKKPFVDFYGDCYKTTSWVEAYSRNIIPVSHPSEWNIPEDVRSRVVYPPPFRAQAGRPKKKRFKSVGEYRNGKTRNCTICGKSGHNRQNCRNAQPCQIPVPSVTSATAATFATSKRPRRPYRCRKCGEEGHNSQKCPLTPEVGGSVDGALAAGTARQRRGDIYREARDDSNSNDEGCFRCDTDDEGKLQHDRRCGR